MNHEQEYGYNCSECNKVFDLSDPPSLSPRKCETCSGVETKKVTTMGQRRPGVYRRGRKA